MHNLNEIQQSPYSCQQLFDLVMDVEHYPQFLPWCRASRILERTEDKIVAELVISFKHITESYVSEIHWESPHSIDVKMVRGPFERLENHWKFIASPEGGSRIHLNLTFQFRSRILDSIIGLLFARASAKMIDAFRKRAEVLYGSKS